MRILITGATGLIGKRLSQYLAHKHSVIALTRNITKALSTLPKGIEPVSCLNKVNFNELDAIINLAGEPIAEGRWTKNKKQKIINSRLELTQQICKKIIESETPPHTLISGSAIGYYGRQLPETQITERFTQCHPEFSHDVCKQWEQMAESARSEQTRVCLLRTGIVLAKDGGALKRMLPPFKCGLGGPIGSGKQIMSWVHLDDMVQLILFILRHREIDGPVNATAPEPVSNGTFSIALANAISRPAFITTPGPVLKLMFGEMADLLLYGQQVIPEKLLDSGYRFRYPNLTEAFQQIFSNQNSG
ncbi:TIGR01777 family oxidoreductase [Pseudoalteromonas sp. T1lg65]|uniref:TIGR01777 family oxidoreductase n=1 Tax=Pseudoalteromonas sp. T1lg65 TaxID=2077101 RepID=UPI003F78DF20